MEKGRSWKGEGKGGGEGEEKEIGVGDKGPRTEG